jgi:hypothetical protein
MTVDPSVVDLLREKTRIEMRSPKLSLNDASLSTLLTGNTFELVPGEGEPSNSFVIAPADKSLLQKPGVVTVTLNAPESYGIEAGQPLILHGVQVGQVLERKLREWRDLLGGHRSAVQRPGARRQQIRGEQSRRRESGTGWRGVPRRQRQRMGQRRHPHSAG